ncbi:hypothetical protein KUCAC02_009902 [Chaenocephalus aceratus]|uniref:Uncharacterized protein n=1 Tax=Chaenocephalus aceratus TaxID=36190 RepID=A0ACB9VYL9_CHAAC|nr:hypothetical protein KUCAC02_009902 [Chaenocephalus aceratus]
MQQPPTPTSRLEEDQRRLRAARAGRASPEPHCSSCIGDHCRGACSTNNNNIQHAGPGSKRDPPHHSTRTWTGARTQSHAAAWESRGGGVCGWLELSGFISLPA